MGIRVQEAKYHGVPWGRKAGKIKFICFNIVTLLKSSQRSWKEQKHWALVANVSTLKLSQIITTGNFNKERKHFLYYKIWIAPWHFLCVNSFRVNAPSKEHMCKSVILENTRCTHEDISGMFDTFCFFNILTLMKLDPLYSRYYCVITQVQKIAKNFHRLLFWHFYLLSMSNLSTLKNY